MGKLQDGGVEKKTRIFIRDFDFCGRNSKILKNGKFEFSDAPDPETLDADSKSVTIVINDNGEINYDEKTLQSIIDSNQPSATVTFVRVSGTEEGENASTGTAAATEDNLEAATTTDPILLLDQEQINRLENVLRSEEAKDILGDVRSKAGNNPNESLGDFLTPSDDVGSTVVPTLETEIDPQPEEEKVPETKAKRTLRTRTSQRQLDRELKEEAEKIRKENQKLLKEEKEAMKKKA